MADFDVGNNSNPNERKELAAAASRLKMDSSSEMAKRYDELVERIIPALEKELHEEHNKYLSNVDLKDIVKSRIMAAIKKANKVIKKIKEKILPIEKNILAAEKNLEAAKRATGYEWSFQKRMIEDEQIKFDKLKIQLDKEEEKLRGPTAVLDENKAELEDLKVWFLGSEKNHPAKVDELEAQLLKARKEAKEILKSVPAFKGGQTRARKNRAGTKRLRRK